MRLQYLWMLLVITLAHAAFGQRSTQINTLYVAPFTGGSDADLFHDGVVRKLSRDSSFKLASSPSSADAIIRGTGQIWVRGYISTNTRTPANNRQAVYGGYLSIEVVSKDGQPLWSWLATPGRLAWLNIVDDLAGQVVKKLSATGALTAAASPAAVHVLAQSDLIGAGATFPAPLYQKWFEDFEQLHQGVHVHYTLTGSQIGVEKLLASKLDFAGSDVAPEVFSQSAPVAHLHRVASAMGAVVAIYNLNGSAHDLHLTPGALADIYMGRVRRWNDPEIRSSNKGVDFPDAEIHVIHRSDGSGTTWIWSNYLSKISPAWASTMGRGATLHWPVGTGAGGNEGVAEAVEKTPDSIGYIELAYAIQHELNFAGIRNRAGEYVHADLDSLAEAATSAGAAADAAGDITDAPGKHAYPIASFTWLLFPSDTADATRKEALTELMRWVLTSGQRECSSLGYAPLPKATADAQLQRLDTAP